MQRAYRDEAGRFDDSCLGKDGTIACPFLGCAHENASMFIFGLACFYVFPVRAFCFWRSPRPAPESKLQLA